MAKTRCSTTSEQDTQPSVAISPDERFGLGRWHCDDLLNNGGLMQCIRAFLEHARAPAISQVGKPRPPLFATLSRDVVGREYRGYWDRGEPKMREIRMPAGTLVRVVMASRFGDVGVTTKLDAEHGYLARVFLPELHDFKASPQTVLGTPSDTSNTDPYPNTTVATGESDG